MSLLLAQHSSIRERVKEQIAKDKADREAALKKEKALTTAAAMQPPTSQPTVKKEYDTCRLQVSSVVDFIMHQPHVLVISNLIFMQLYVIVLSSLTGSHHNNHR